MVFGAGGPVAYAAAPQVNFAEQSIALSANVVGMVSLYTDENAPPVIEQVYFNDVLQILQTQGFVKLVRAPEGPVVGIHMVGSRVSERGFANDPVMAVRREAAAGLGDLLSADLANNRHGRGSGRTPP